MSTIQLRTLRPDEFDAVAELIHNSTNAWYIDHGHAPIFPGPPSDALLFTDVYESLDPGCCIVAEDTAARRLAGSCFYHPRATHVSLGIMNVHPDYFGQGVGRRILKEICDHADQAGKPVRLVSSAMNLDSFSLYTRAGFVPRMLFHDLTMPVPADGVKLPPPPGRERVREATMDDVDAIVALERELVGIERAGDYRFFIENALGIWRLCVIESPTGGIDGFLASISAPASHMLGPGVARSAADAAALIHAQLDHHRGAQPVWLVPAAWPDLVRVMYDWRAANCELHLAQCRGAWRDPTGVVLPTFMPETG